MGPLVGTGLLDAGEVRTLDPLRAHNALLFAPVLKQRVGGRGARLADAVFRTRRHFGPAAR